MISNTESAKSAQENCIECVTWVGMYCHSYM